MSYLHDIAVFDGTLYCDGLTEDRWLQLQTADSIHYASIAACGKNLSNCKCAVHAVQAYHMHASRHFPLSCWVCVAAELTLHHCVVALNKRQQLTMPRTRQILCCLGPLHSFRGLCSEAHRENYGMCMVNLTFFVEFVITLRRLYLDVNPLYVPTVL